MSCQWCPCALKQDLNYLQSRNICCIEQLTDDMVKDVETVFFFVHLQYSIYDVTVLKVHRRLPATSRQNTALTQELMNWWKRRNKFSSLLVVWYFIMMSDHCLQNQCYLQHQAKYYLQITNNWGRGEWTKNRV